MNIFPVIIGFPQGAKWGNADNISITNYVKLGCTTFKIPEYTVSASHTVQYCGDFRGERKTNTCFSDIFCIFFLTLFPFILLN